MSDDEIFLNVDRKTLEQILVLVRDKFGVAMTANYFLEHQAGISGANIAITNLRDVLSHLASLLGGPGNSMPLSIDEQKAQLVSAEEHFRRAVYEPYEHAANTGVVNLNKTIERFKEVVVSRGPSYSTDRGYPSLEVVNSRWRAIGDLRTAGRAAKGVNLWNAQWEESVKKLVQVNEAIANFVSDLEKIIIVVEADKSVELGEQGLNTARRSDKTGKWGIFWTIVTAAIAAAFTWYLAKHT